MQTNERRRKAGVKEGILFFAQKHKTFHFSPKCTSGMGRFSLKITYFTSLPHFYYKHTQQFSTAI